MLSSAEAKLPSVQLMAENVLFCQPRTAEERCVLCLLALLYNSIEKFLIFKVAFIVTGIYPNNNNSTDKSKQSLNSFHVVHCSYYSMYVLLPTLNDVPDWQLFSSNCSMIEVILLGITGEEIQAYFLATLKQNLLLYPVKEL